jgi:hypothetical protein
VPYRSPYTANPRWKWSGRARNGAREGCDLVIALGGGSAIDAGKAIAALLGQRRRSARLPGGSGAGEAADRPSAPFIAIPTTAGTGAEVTRNAVLARPSTVSRPACAARTCCRALAVVDPELHAGSAARAHRQHGSRRADAAHRAVRLVPRQPYDGSLLRGRHAAGGIRAAAGLARRPRSRGPHGHGFRQPAGRPGAGQCRPGRGARIRGAAGRYVRCAAWRTLRGAAAARHAGEHRRAARPSPSHAESCCATVPSRASSRAAPAPRPRTARPGSPCLCRDLEIRPLGAYGVRPADVPALADAAARASSMKANPIVLTRGQLEELLTRAI